MGPQELNLVDLVSKWLSAHLGLCWGGHDKKGESKASENQLRMLVQELHSGLCEVTTHVVMDAEVLVKYLGGQTAREGG